MSYDLDWKGETPDLIEPILACRAWLVRPASFRDDIEREPVTIASFQGDEILLPNRPFIPSKYGFHGVGVTYRWSTGVNEAKCNRSATWRDTVCNTHGDRVCVKECTCGFWAFNNVECLYEYFLHGPSNDWDYSHYMFGVVKMWGRMVQAESGWRAQFAQPLCLVLDDRLAMEQLKQSYRQLRDGVTMMPISSLIDKYTRNFTTIATSLGIPVVPSWKDVTLSQKLAA
jgi:hypothetical protein